MRFFFLAKVNETHVHVFILIFLLCDVDTNTKLVCSNINPCDFFFRPIKHPELFHLAAY